MPKKAALAVLAILIVTYLVLVQRRGTGERNFPTLAAGAYSGALTLFGEKRERIPFFLEIAPDGRIDGVWMVEGEREFSVALGDGPLVVKLPAGVEPGEVNLAGGEQRTGEWSGGAFRAGESEPVGDWAFTAVASSKPPRASDEFNKYLAARSDLEGVTRRMKTIQDAIKAREESIRQLTLAITSDDVPAKIEEKTADKQQSLERLAQLRKEWDLAAELSPRGRLVATARRFLDREDAWIEASLAPFVSGKFPAELQPALERAERIDGLRRLIDNENQAVEQLLYPSQEARPGAEAPAPRGSESESDEESYYSDMLGKDGQD